MKANQVWIALEIQPTDETKKKPLFDYSSDNAICIYRRHFAYHIPFESLTKAPLFLSYHFYFWLWMALSASSKHELELGLKFPVPFSQSAQFYLWRSCRKRSHPSNSFHKWLVLLCPWSVLFWWQLTKKKREELVWWASYQRDLWTLLYTSANEHIEWTLFICRLQSASSNVLETLNPQCKIRLHKTKPIEPTDTWFWWTFLSLIDRISQRMNSWTMFLTFCSGTCHFNTHRWRRFSIDKHPEMGSVRWFLTKSWTHRKRNPNHWNTLRHR